MPKNNQELEMWSVKYERFENLVGDRHRSASRERREYEYVPTPESTNVLSNWWLSKEQPYIQHTVPKPLSGEEGVNYVIENGEPTPS